VRAGRGRRDPVALRRARAPRAPRWRQRRRRRDDDAPAERCCAEARACLTIGGDPGAHLGAGWRGASRSVAGAGRWHVSDRSQQSVRYDNKRTPICSGTHTRTSTRRGGFPRKSGPGARPDHRRAKPISTRVHSPRICTDPECEFPASAVRQNSEQKSGCDVESSSVCPQHTCGAWEGGPEPSIGSIRLSGTAPSPRVGHHDEREVRRLSPGASPCIIEQLRLHGHGLNSPPAPCSLTLLPLPRHTLPRWR
jgi:hypothetical protein